MYAMNIPDDKSRSLVISYLTLRKAIGILGMLLPVVLFTGYFLLGQDCSFPPSISHFYYTDLGNLLIGVLCGVSLFLFCYKGYDQGDKIAARTAALFAFLVAMFPTNFGSYEGMQCSRLVNGGNTVSNWIHYLSATILFSTFSFFCLVQFTKTDKRGPLSAAKRMRNDIYVMCGWIIIGCIVCIGLVSFIDPVYEQLKWIKPTFALEAIALFAFGFSWLIKGDTFFRDKTEHS